ncbi:MAG: lytic murein transglycosylase B [Gammaproteobacteria bacterium]|nr:lytic murein transglycosylase B [Gammaproteobacteria bacterium]
MTALLTGLMWMSVGSSADAADGFDADAEIRPFAVRMQTEHGMNPAEVERILGQAQVSTRVLDAMSRPAEARLTWAQYRKIFIQPARIDGGVKFWNEHVALLDRAQKDFGVPQSVIVAIIGVETLYGRRKGDIKVLDALATLAFRFPRRAEFFGRELAQYLLMTREERLDPLTQTGSYAGAMGIPQFIPSSYRHYAVDFDDDGVRDLLRSEADAIGSVASYLARHGWEKGGVVTVPAEVDESRVKPIVDKGLKPHTAVAELRKAGVRSRVGLPADAPAALIELEGDAGREFWLGMNNFYVITRYNRSPLYAMAVHQLAEAIAARRGRAASAGARGGPVGGQS